MSRRAKFELIAGFDGADGPNRTELCVDWWFSDHVEFDRADLEQDGCNCVVTNVEFHSKSDGDIEVTCNQWLNWEGGGIPCPVHEWVYQDYRDHVRRSIENMRNPVPPRPTFPVEITVMK